MNRFLPFFAGVMFVSTLAAEGPAPVPTPPARPNIVVILADDLGFSDLGCYGGEIRTPNLDALAAEGLRFTQFYNASKCEVTRASLLSGMYWQQTRRGIRRGITLGQALQTAGYVTLAVGKWHLLGNPVDRGFDRYFGFLRGATNYFKGDPSFRLDHDPFQPPADGFYTTDAFTDRAIQFVGEAHQQSPAKPFFLYLAYNAPHSPLQAPAEDIARYRGTYDRGWDHLRQERYQRQLALGVVHPEWQLSARPDDIPAWDSLSADTRRLEAARMGVYAAMVDRLDQNVGRFLAKLKEWHLDENTLVVFLSDNGANPYDRTGDRSVPPGGANSTWENGLGWANLCDTPFRFYKRFQHEGGVATPFIARWPRLIRQPGGLTDQPAHVVDIMATCVQLSGCDYARAFDARNTDRSVTAASLPLAGISLSPLLEGRAWAGHDALFFQLRDHRAVRTPAWELVSHDSQPWELYRMDTDRTETHDLAGQDPSKAKELQSIYERWWNRDDVAKATDHSEVPVYIDPAKPREKPIGKPVGIEALDD